MEDVEIRFHMPQQLREWGIREFEERSVKRLYAIKGGRRAGIMKGELTIGASQKRQVAIKVVNDGYASRSENPRRRIRLLVEYFKRECRIWTAIRAHPNIVPLLGFVSTSQTEAFPSLVMPYYDSGSLKIFIQQHQVGLKVKVGLMQDVASGLEYMHSLEPPAIHRDIKASNILVEVVDSKTYRGRIADFGSAKLAEIESDVQVTGGTSAPVSSSWTPPEYIITSGTTDDILVNYTHPTTEGDVWSFGCTFYEVLLGARPWAGYAVGTELLHGRHPPRPENGYINDECWTVMLACWLKNPALRPPAAQLVWNLQAIVNKLVETE